MAKFNGGPYDGMDLPFDPCELRRINLPELDKLDEYLNDRDGTSLHSWPYHYLADDSTDPPQYRFLDPRGRTP